MRWGLSLSLAGELGEPSVIADVAATAETAGWDGVFVWDHLWNRTLEPFADPWVTLAAVAVATERVRLGPLVTPLPGAGRRSSPSTRRRSIGCQAAG